MKPSTKSSKRSRRSGYSLIECIVFLTAVSIILGLSATLIHNLLKLDRTDRQRADAAEMVASLGQTLRNDAHASTKAVEVTAAKISLAFDDGRAVVYQVEPTRIVRTLKRPDKSTHYDVFNLPRRVSAKLEKRGGTGSGTGSGESLAIVLDEKDEPGRAADGPYRKFSIEANLATDPRPTLEAKP